MARLLLVILFVFILSSTRDAASASSSSTSTSSSSASTSSSSDGSVSSASSSSASVVCSDAVKCKPNEEFSNCTQALGRRLKCSQQGKPVPCATTPKRCKSGCVCQAGYLKTANGTCVPETQCYGDLVCDDTEVVNSCPKNRVNDFCPKSEKDTAKCSSNGRSRRCRKPVCTCRFNYKRDPKSRKCIPTRDCPPFDCRSNEEYNACPPACPSDSCSQATPSGRCPIFGRIGIVVECKPTCRCVKGSWRNNGTCVPYLECPGKCPTNEKFSSCIQGECRALNCTQKDQPIACPFITEGSCKKGCVCVEGTLRDANGSCVPEDKCPVVCPANEEFSNCTQAVCRELNCSQRGQKLDCQSADSNEVDEESCQSGCICQAGYLRTANGACVPVNQCYGDLVCKDTETVNTCPNYGFDDHCPTSEEDAQLETKVVSEPCTKDPECTCRFNYKRLKNGTCVPTVDCPPFNCSGKYQEYNPCPPLCPSDDCSQATPTGRCPAIGRIGIVLTCSPNCRCIPGYWKNNGVCVPYAACPGKCPSNEQFSSCAQAICRAENCQQKGQPIACPEIDEGSCEKRCVCVEGTLRDANGTCVPEDQCPAPTCGKNEVLEECGNACSPVDCPESYKEEQARLKDCFSVAACLPTECRCIPNYRRNSNGKCVYIGECPGICPKNEEFSSCAQAICRAENCKQKGQPIACPEIDEGSCEKRCVCVEGTLRDANGTCVPEDQCPAPTCGENEVLEECGNACSPVDCPKSYKEEQARLKDCFSAAVCLPTECRCIPNCRRNSNGKCVYIGECPGICPKNEEFSNCTQTCGRPQNCTQSKTISSPEVEEGSCKSGCICKAGRLRNANGTCVPEEQCPDAILATGQCHHWLKVGACVDCNVKKRDKLVLADL